MRTALGKVRGLGSAKTGTQHFWHQRLTALALVPLAVWFMASLVGLAGADHASVIAFIHAPVATIAFLLFVAAGFYHLTLGLQVVIEDYIHDHGLKLALLFANTLFCAVTGLAAVLAILKISLGA